MQGQEIKSKENKTHGNRGGGERERGEGGIEENE